jgi:hypothetical protein
MSHRTWFKRLGLLGATLIVLLCTALAGVSMLLQAQPATPVMDDIKATDVGTARRLLQRDELREAFHGKAVTLSLTPHEINALLHDMSRRLIGGAGQVTLGQGRADVALSLPVQRTPLRSLALLGDWVNVYATVSAKPSGPPTLVSVRVGRVSIPPDWALWGARQVALHYQVSEAADMALTAVEHVSIEPKRAQVTARLSDTVKAQALTLLAPKEDWDKLRVYHQLMAKVVAYPKPGQIPATATLPLIDVMRPLFELAHQRTLLQGFNGDSANLSEQAMRENRAVLLVLAMYIGHVPVAHVMPAAQGWTPADQQTLTLRGRGDFAQHFVLSALLATDLGGRLADAVGIYKELLDSTPGGTGSGFSFNDIAADKTGVSFGRRAMMAPLELQARVGQGENDAFYMPDVSDLPEFLSQADFQQRYGGVGAPAYNKVLESIEQRVADLDVLH